MEKSWDRRWSKRPSMDYSLPVSSVQGILQTTILEYVAIPSPGDLPDPGIKPRSPVLGTRLICFSGNPSDEGSGEWLD